MHEQSDFLDIVYVVDVLDLLQVESFLYIFTKTSWRATNSHQIKRGKQTDSAKVYGNTSGLFLAR